MLSCFFVRCFVFCFSPSDSAHLHFSWIQMSRLLAQCLCRKSVRAEGCRNTQLMKSTRGPQGDFLQRVHSWCSSLDFTDLKQHYVEIGDLLSVGHPSTDGLLRYLNVDDCTSMTPSRATSPHFLVPPTQAASRGGEGEMQGEGSWGTKHLTEWDICVFQ